ncbi:MAG: hypothetical protein KBT86_13485, partial [Gammaproteobacteria bacterium]|nr:hypothetical protein [Gammaproteobacteria bacterium]
MASCGVGHRLWLVRLVGQIYSGKLVLGLGIMKNVTGVFFAALSALLSLYSPESYGAASEQCELYPFTLSESLIREGEQDEHFQNVPLGTGEGNYSWLAWRGDNDAPTIAAALLPPGNSHLYINPSDSSDTQLDVGDWVEGAPGVKNSKAIRSNLQALVGRDIIVPVWGDQSGTGSNRNYSVTSFATIEITDFKLNGKGWLSFILKGGSSCTDNPPLITSEPPTVTPEQSTYSYQLLVDGDATNASLLYSLTNAPSSMQINAATGLVSWIPPSHYVQSVPTLNNQCYQLAGMPVTTDDSDPVGEAVAPLYQRVQAALEHSSGYAATAAAAWQQENQCQACHVQSPVLAGVEASAKTVSVDEAVAAELLNGVLDSQQADGGFYNESYGGIGNQTALALWSLSESRQTTETLEARANALRFMLARQQADGVGVYWEPDHNTGWLDNRFALSAMMALSANRFVLDATSQGVADQYLTLQTELEQLLPKVADYLFARSNVGAPTQQLALELVALNEIQRSFVLNQSESLVQDRLTVLENELRLRQRSDGGWAFAASDVFSDPVTSTWVGRALDYASPALSDLAVLNNIRYLLVSQQADGAWLSQGGQFSQRLAATGLVMSYLPVAMEYLGSPDVRVGHIFWQEQSDDQVRLTADVSNRGLADVFVPVSVTFFNGVPENERVLGQTTLFGLPSGAESIAEIRIDKSWVTDDVTVVLGVTPLSDECHISNNKAIAGFVSTAVTNSNNQSDTQSWLVNVDDVNQPPRINSDPVTEINSGQRYHYRVSVVDADVGDAHSFSLLDAPEPFLIDKKTGVLSSRRNSLSAGEHTLTVQVVDLRGALDVQSFTLLVAENSPPAITSDAEMAQQEHLPYQYHVMAEDPNEGDEPQFTLQKSPDLADIDRLSGALSWLVNDQMYVDPLVGENQNCVIGGVFNIEDIAPQVKWHWSGEGGATESYRQVMMSPIVVPLQDTNGDGRHSSDDEMAVVFGAFSGGNYLRGGFLRAISGKTGQKIWTSSQIINDSGAIAAADLNGDGLTEIVAQLRAGQYGAFDHQGNLIWASSWRGEVGAGGAAIADIDADGTPEIIVPGGVLDYEGRLIFTIKYNPHALPYAADVDGDGFQEIVDGGNLYSHTGELLFERAGRYSAVGNFDDDPEAEIVIVNQGGVSLVNHDGSLVWSDKPLGTGGGGAPTIANMIGDDFPEIGIAGSSKYVVMDRFGEVVWSSPTRDFSSRVTGSSVFDFNGDGKAEVTYADEYTFRIYEGSTGRVLFEEPNSSGTLLELPVIADVDGDGHAEVVVASNSYVPWGSVAGIRVFEGLNGWAPTRAIWNQHAYSISNINDDMSVPARPNASWLAHNTFRLNTFPDRGTFDQADLSLANLRYNEDADSLSVDIANRGNAAISNVFDLVFTYHDSVNGEEALGQVSVNGLAGQQSRVIELAVPDLVLDGDVSVSINASGIEECNVDNNDTRAAAFEVRAYDEGGLWDSQRFLMSATNTNEAPRIVSRVASSVEQGQLFELQVEVEDPDRGDSFRYALANAPAEFKINPVTGRVSAEGLLQGSVQLDIRVTDNAGAEAVQQHIVSVSEPSNYPPVFESEPVVTAKPLQDYRYVVEATDPEGGEVSYFLNRAPEGMSINGLTGAIHWYPEERQVSLYSVEVVAMDELGASSFQYFLVDTQIDSGNLIPVITSEPQGFVYAGQAYQYLVQAYDPDGNDLAFYLEHAEPEMSITASGSFTWIPPVERVGQIGYATIVVEDLHGGVAKQRITLPVSEPSNHPPRITSSPQTTVLLGNDWLYSAAATDEDGDTIHFSLLHAPNGMQLQNDTLYWTPAQAQVGMSHDVALYAIDARGAAAVQRFSVSVIDATNGNQPPVILSEPNSSPTLGETWLYQVVANDADGDALSYDVLEGPLGVAIDDDGLVSWTPSSDFSNAQVALSIQVSDGRGGRASQSVLLGIVTPDTMNQVPDVTSTPPTPATVNVVWQYAMQVVDADGDSLSWALTEAPSGMSIDNNGVVTWTPTAVGHNRISIRVGDGRAWVYQVFDLPVVDAEANNSAPEITSAANTQAVAEQLYVYAVQATDVEGDSLSYSLLTAPAGMGISNAGVITWQAPMQASDHSVVVQVSDGHQVVSQAYTLLVRADRNRAPRILSLPESEAVQSEAYRYQVVASDPDGDAISYALLTSPTGMTIDNVGLIRWLPNADQVGNHEVQVAVRDGEYSALQTWLLHVYQEPLPLSVSIHLENSVLSPGDVLPVSLDVIGASENAIIALTNDGENVIVDPFGRAYITAQTAGRHDLFASVSDGEFSTEASAFYTVRDPSDDQAPQVTLHRPVENSVITAPSDVVASISDATLAAWTLYLSPKAQQNWQVIAEGRDAASAAVIGTLDPTLLVNGQYDLVLQAVDANGQSASDNMTVMVDGDLKVGNFTITLEDLNIPVAGIPVRVTRTYDSRRRNEPLDFGYGWSVGYQDAKVEESRTPGLYWALNEYKRGPYNAISDFCVEPQGAPVVTVTLPNGDVERFEAHAFPECSTFQVVKHVDLRFRAVGDTQSELEVLGDDSAYFDNGQLVDTASFTNPINPDRYKLTTRGGYVYELDQAFGVRRIVDPNGHTLTYSNDGIVHSSGKAIRFNRDSLGRITTITDPKGHVLEYDYNRSGDLVANRDALSNQSAQSYNRGHGLLDIIDPLGRRIVRNIYDDDGRMIAQEDSDGHRTDFNHDIAGRQSVVTDRLGNTTFLYYDDEGQVTQRVDAIGNTTSYGYDARGNQLTETNAQGKTSKASYNDSNDQLTQENELGHITRFGYNTRGQETVVTDALGNQYNNAYDAVGNLLSVTDPTGNIAGNHINAKGLVTKTVDMLGNETDYTYDGDGNKLTETNAEGHLTTWTYDDNGNVLTESVTRTVNGQP